MRPYLFFYILISLIIIISACGGLSLEQLEDTHTGLVIVVGKQPLHSEHIDHHTNTMQKQNTAHTSHQTLLDLSHTAALLHIGTQAGFPPIILDSNYKHSKKQHIEEVQALCKTDPLCLQLLTLPQSVVDDWLKKHYQNLPIASKLSYQKWIAQELHKVPIEVHHSPLWNAMHHEIPYAKSLFKNVKHK